MRQRLQRYFIPNIGTLILMALMLFVYRASAAPSGPTTPDATPGTLSYQGMLNDAAGQPINGSTGITFRLYNTPMGGTALWTETHTSANAVPISNGLFNVLLGSLNPIPASVWSNTNIYLGVQVGNDAEMSPRELIGEVPLAKMGLTVPDGAIGTNQIADGAITTTKIMAGAITPIQAPFAPQHFIGISSNPSAKVSTGTYVVALTGGSRTETVDINLFAPLGFTSAPVGVVQIVDSAGPDLNVTLARYTYDGSTSTTARIIFFRTDGNVLTNGNVRVNLILWNN